MGLGKGVEFLAPLFVFWSSFFLSHTQETNRVYVRTHADWERS